jgi:predicted nucleic acid-binding protein
MEWLKSLDRQDAAVLSGQVLREYYNVLMKPSKPFKYSRERARRNVEDLYIWLPEIAVDDRFEDAWHIQERYGFSWFDSLLLAAAAHAGCSAYVSEDLQNGQIVEGVLIVDPFRNEPVATLAQLSAAADY